MIKNHILNKISLGKKIWCILLDPDKLPIDKIDYLFSLINNFIFNDYIKKIKAISKKPIIIFPGNNQQISQHADGLFLLSLISGRNPDLLIGQHVKAAFKLKESNLEILPCGYLLIEGDSLTSAIYMSESLPIPKNKSEIAAATALAGELLGLQFIYLDKGSGSKNTVQNQMIKTVKKNIKIPLIVGGGINDRKDLENVWKAGADIAVIGTSIEKNLNNVLLFDKIYQ